QADGADPVPPRDEVALHLDVPQALLEGAAVARQQGLVDAAALLAEPAVGQPARWAALTPSLSVKALDELASHALGQEEQGVVPQLHEQARVDLIVAEVGVARPALGHALRPPEADRAPQRGLAGEHPMEPVERPLVAGRVVLQSADRTST